MEKWINIKYDYMPKYCKTCKLQAYNEKECFVIHLELYLECFAIHLKLYPKEDKVDEQQ